MKKNTVFIDDNKIVCTDIRLNWATAIEIFKKFYFMIEVKKLNKLKIDFSRVRLIIPNGIIPIISEINRLRQNKIRFDIIPPNDQDIIGYSNRMGYLHFLDPSKYEYPAMRHQNFSLHNFHTEDELNEVITGAVEVSLQQLQFAYGVPQAFEWVLNELADNVLIHSGISTGWLQILTNRDLHLLTIVVCDSGVGIPYNMKEAYPTIKSDCVAI